MLVIVGTSKDAHSLRSQVGIGSDCLFGQFDRILWISGTEVGEKDEKSTGIAVGDSECGVRRSRRRCRFTSIRQVAATFYMPPSNYIVSPRDI